MSGGSQLLLYVRNLRQAVLVVHVLLVTLLKTRGFLCLKALGHPLFKRNEYSIDELFQEKSSDRIGHYQTSGHDENAGSL